MIIKPFVTKNEKFIDPEKYFFFPPIQFTLTSLKRKRERKKKSIKILRRSSD
jgi:hypothetical protein